MSPETKFKNINTSSFNDFTKRLSRRTFERTILEIEMRRSQENLITIITIMGDKPRSGKRQVRFYDLGIGSFAI